MKNVLATLALLIAVFCLAGGLVYADKPPADDKVITPTSTPPLELMYPKDGGGGFGILSITPGWTQKSPTGGPPGVRNNHEMVWDGSNGILFGGWLSGSYNYNDTWWYSPVSNTWTNKSPASSPPGKSCTAMVWDGAECILFGGSNTGTRSNDTWWYNPSNNTWTNKNPSSPPAARFYHRMVWDGARAIMFGGNTASGYMNDLWWYEPISNTWTQKIAQGAGGSPAARGQCGLVWDGTRVIMFGGYSSAGGAYNDLWWYDPGSNAWTQKIANGASGSPAARWTHTLTWSLTRAVLFGGYDSSAYRNDVWWYNSADNTWFKKIDNNSDDPSKRGGHTMIWDGIRDIMFAGYDTAYRNDLWWYDPDSTGPTGAISIDTSSDIGNAVSFSPTPNSFTTKVLVPHNSALDPANITVSGWVKTSDTGAYRGVVGKGFTGGGWYMDINSGTLRFMVKSSAGTFYTATHSGTVNNGNWHHVVGVFNSATGTVSVYLDGAKGTDATGASKGTTTNDMEIGGGSSSGAAYSLNGTVDEVKLYNIAWTLADVGYEYNSTNGLYGHSNDPDIVCGYHLDESSGITATNFVGNPALDGTLSGSPTPTWVTGKVYKLNVNPTYISATPPAVIIYLAVSDPDSGLYKMRFKNDSDSWQDNWETFAKTKSWTLSSGDGTKYVYSQVTNSFGITSTDFSDSIILDTSGPTGEILINNGATYTASTAVDVYLNVTDTQSGCNQMRLWNDNDSPPVTWTPFSSPISWTLTATDGERTVHAEVKNYAGLTSTFLDTIILDRTPPTGSIIINNGAEYVTDTLTVTVTLNVTDTLSGCVQMRFKNDNDSWLDNWETFSTTKIWDISGADLTCTVWAEVKNGAGLSDTFSDYIWYDNTAPSGSISINDGAQYTSNTNVTVNLSAVYDPFPTSGLDKMRFKNESDADWSGWQDYASSASYTVSATDGTRIIWAQVKNKAGLVNSPDFSDTIILDRTPPEPFGLLTPTNDSIVLFDVAPLVFNWQTATDTNPVTYKLVVIDPTQAATAGGHSSSAKTVVTGITQTSYQMSQPVKAGTSYWEVQAADAAGNTRWGTGSTGGTSHCHTGDNENISANQFHTSGSACGAHNNCGDPQGARTSLNPGIDYSSGNANLNVPVTHVVPNTALESNVTLYYNSKGDTLGGYGQNQNWSHTFSQVLIPSASPAISTSYTVTYRKPDGQRIIYRETAQGSDSYRAFDHYGDESVLTDYNSAGYALIYHPQRGVTYTFSANNIESVYELTRIEDRNGNAVTCTYTAQDNVQIVTLPGGRTISFTYDQFNNYRLQYIDDPASNRTTVGYNVDGKVNEISQDSGNWKWQFAYYAGTNRISSATNPANKTNSYQYWPDGKFWRVDDAIGGVSTVTVDTPTATATVNRLGETTTFKYDLALDTWKASTDSYGNATTNVFDTRRNLTKQTNPRGYSTEYVYNDRGNVTVITAQGTAELEKCVTKYEYSDPLNLDLPTYITDARLTTTKLEYDSKGKLIRRTEAVGLPEEQVVTYSYYADGRLEREIRDPSGLNLQTFYQYYANGYLQYKNVMLDGNTITYEFQYDTLGRMTKAYNPYDNGTPRGPFTEYQYDYRGNNTVIIGPYTVDPNTSYIRTEMQYDNMDRLFWRVDDAGTGRKNVGTLYTYNDVGWLTDVTQDYGGLNLLTHTDYYSTGRVWKVTAPTGAITEYTYYDNGRMHETKQQLNATETAITEYQYDANGNTLWVKDPELHQTNYTYYANDKLQTVTDALNNQTAYYYSDCGCCQASTVVDPVGNETYNSYDALKRVKYSRSGNGAGDYISTAYTYDKAGRRTRVTGPWYDTDGDGIVDAGESKHPTLSQSPMERNYTYDKASRVTSIDIFGLTQTAYAYNAMGNVTQATDAVNVVTQYGYDNLGLVTLNTIDPSGLNEQTAFWYDGLKRQVQVIRAYQAPSLMTYTAYEYDNVSRLTRQYDPMSSTYQTTYAYYNNGLEKWVIDANNNTTKYYYDKGGRLVQTTDARGYSIVYHYTLDSLQDKVTYVRGGNSVDTTYEYYNNHWLWKANYPGFTSTNTTTYVYWGNGNIQSKTDANGTNFTYTYDHHNRLTLKQYNGANNVTYSYDAASNVLTILDTNTNLTYGYDPFDRLTQVVDNFMSKTINYTYYNDGMRQTMTDPATNVITYQYDNAKRLKQVLRNGTQEAFYNYNGLGQRTQLQRGTPVVAVTDYQYNHQERWLTQVNNWTPATPMGISTFGYGYDLVGNKTSMGLLSGDTLAYNYDNAYQVITETRVGGTAYQIGWSYDEVGNRLTQNKSGQMTTYAYNNANQLLNEVTGATPTNYAYDANGNNISKTSFANTWIYGYDPDNHLTQYNDPLTMANNATYMYNALGHRTQKLVGGYAEQYVYDGANIVADYSGTVTATYVTPFLDENLLVTRYAPLVANYYYTQDGLGSVRDMLNAAGMVVNTYDYTAFGEPLNWVETVPNRYKFTAREWDGESNLYSYRPRMENPATGKFLQRDPIGYSGGINLYAYVGNNSVNRIDPWGLAPTCITTEPLDEFGSRKAPNPNEELQKCKAPCKTAVTCDKGWAGPGTFPFMLGGMCCCPVNDKDKCPEPPKYNKALCDDLRKQLVSAWEETYKIQHDRYMIRYYMAVGIDTGAQGPYGKSAFETAMNRGLDAREKVVSQKIFSVEPKFIENNCPNGYKEEAKKNAEIKYGVKMETLIKIIGEFEGNK